MMKPKIMLARVVVLLGVVAGLDSRPAYADTLIVDDDGVQCPGAGFTTIQDAVTAAIAGDEITVCPGSYSGTPGTVTVTKPGLKLKASGAVIFTGSPAGAPGFNVLASDVTISGFTIKDTSRSGIEVRGSGVTIKGNTLLNTGDPTNSTENCGGGRGINIEGLLTPPFTPSSNNSVKENVIDNACRGALRLVNVTDSLIQENKIGTTDLGGSTFRGSRSRPGIPLREGSTATSIKENVVNNNCEAGISVHGSTGNVIQENSMVGNGSPATCPRPPEDGSSTDADDNTTGAGTAGTGNVWQENNCVTQSPAGLCDD